MKKIIIASSLFLGGIFLFSAIIVATIVSVPYNFATELDSGKLLYVIEFHDLKLPFYFSMILIFIGIILFLHEAIKGVRKRL